MTLSLLHGLPLAGALLATALPTADDTLTFGPVAGTTSTKTFREVTTLSLESATVTVGPEQMPTDSLSIDLEQSRTVAVTDVYDTSAGGAPRSLRRTYDEIDTAIELDLTDPSGSSETADIEADHPLEGLEVAFTWNEESQESEPTFVEADAGDAALLEGLRVDMDLCSLLVPLEESDAPFEAGDRWKVAPASFLALTRPGGIGFVPFEVDDEEQVLGLFLTALVSCRDGLDAPEGDVEMWWKNTREIDGHSCAVFDLDVDITGTADVTALLLDQIKGLLPDIRGEVDVFDLATLEMALEGEGELVWDLTAGRLASLEIELENTSELHMTGSIDDGDEPMALDLSLTLTGESVLSVEVE